MIDLGVYFYNVTCVIDDVCFVILYLSLSSDQG